MASFHLSATMVKRSQGHSAVAASAYANRLKLEDQRTGQSHNYSRRTEDVLWSAVMTPKQSPDWHRDRAQVWNSVEMGEKRKDAQLARNIIVALPHELTTEQQTFILKDFIREQFNRKGYVVDAAMHRPDQRGDQRNVHAHLLVSLRPVEKDGTWGAKVRTFSDTGKPPQQELAELREAWAKRCNRELEKHGHEARIDHRTLEAQGITRTPEVHAGKNAVNMARDGKESDRAEQLARTRAAHRMQQEAERIEREHANANAQARDRANDDHPAISKQTFTGDDATAEVAQAQSAIDRMKAEERAEQIEALRALGRNRWAAMGDQLREMISTVRRLATTMGATLGNIIKGGGFTRDQDENVGKNARSASSVNSASSGAVGATTGRKDFTQNRQTAAPGEAMKKQQEAPKPAPPVTPMPTQQTAAPATSTSVPRVATEDPLKVLERLAAERRAKKERQDAEKAELARKRLRDGLPVNKPSRKRDFDF